MNADDVSLGALRCFVDVATEGSFAAVARRRLVDPSIVSRTIAGLERELGFRLFDRTTRRLNLTEAGAIYLQRAGTLVGMRPPGSTSPNRTSTSASPSS